MELDRIKNYEIHVIKHKDHEDTTQPIDIADVEGFSKNRQYYHINLLCQKEMMNGCMRRPQKASVSVTVFNSSDQRVLFQDIQDALGSENNYIEKANGDLLISPKVMSVGGRMMQHRLPFIYELLQKNPKTGVLEPLRSMKSDGKGGYKLVNATSQTIKFFVHEEEDEEVRKAIEIERARDRKVSATDEDDEVETEEVEEEPEIEEPEVKPKGKGK